MLKSFLSFLINFIFWIKVLKFKKLSYWPQTFNEYMVWDLRKWLGPSNNKKKYTSILFHFWCAEEMTAHELSNWCHSRFIDTSGLKCSAVTLCWHCEISFGPFEIHPRTVFGPRTDFGHPCHMLFTVKMVICTIYNKWQQQHFRYVLFTLSENSHSINVM